MKMFKDIKIDDDLFFYRIIPETEMVSETKTFVLSTWKHSSVDAISFSIDHDIARTLNTISSMFNVDGYMLNRSFGVATDTIVSLLPLTTNQVKALFIKRQNEKIRKRFRL